jgi:hypothetical protein
VLQASASHTTYDVLPFPVYFTAKDNFIATTTSEDLLNNWFFLLQRCFRNVATSFLHGFNIFLRKYRDDAATFVLGGCLVCCDGHTLLV